MAWPAACHSATSGRLSQPLHQPEMAHHVRGVRDAEVTLGKEREVPLDLAGRELRLEVPEGPLARVLRASSGRPEDGVRCARVRS